MADKITKTDKEQGKGSVYDEHTQAYTQLLYSFIRQSHFSSTLKNKLKAIFFGIIVFLMILLVIIFYYSIYKTFKIINSSEVTDSVNKENFEYIAGAITAMISSLVTVIISLFKLPKIIAKYLFNPEEDKNMVSVIEKIQNYDVAMYSIENDIERKLIKLHKEKGNVLDHPTPELEGKLIEPKDDTSTEPDLSNN